MWQIFLLFEVAMLTIVLYFKKANKSRISLTKMLFYYCFIAPNEPV